MFKYIKETTFNLSSHVISSIESLDFPKKPISKEDFDNYNHARFGRLLYEVANGTNDIVYPVTFNFGNHSIQFTRQELLDIYEQSENYRNVFGHNGVFLRTDVVNDIADKIMAELPNFLKKHNPKFGIHIIYDRGQWPHIDRTRVCSLHYSLNGSNNWTTTFWHDCTSTSEFRFNNFINDSNSFWKIPSWGKLKSDFQINIERHKFYVMDHNSFHSVHCNYYDEPRRAFLIEFETISAKQLYQEMVEHGYC